MDLAIDGILAACTCLLFLESWLIRRRSQVLLAWQAIAAMIVSWTFGFALFLAVVAAAFAADTGTLGSSTYPAPYGLQLIFSIGLICVIWKSLQFSAQNRDRSA